MRDIRASEDGTRGVVPKQVPEKEVQAQEVMQRAVELMKDAEGEGGVSTQNDEKWCFWLPNQKGLELFMCVYVKKLNPLFLFHYDRRGKKLNQVTEVIYNKSASSKMQFRFKEGGASDVTGFSKLSLAWLQKWGTNLTPESHCKITKENENNATYKLTCNSSSKTSGSSEWSHQVNPEPPYKKN